MEQLTQKILETGKITKSDLDEKEFRWLELSEIG